jgi:LRR receptor-like serine/threonine-protein kinase FLS2
VGFEIRNEFLLRTFGIVEDPRYGMIMVLEFADGGSLHDKVIGVAADSAPGMQQIIAWLCEVSEGMRVLHNQATPILHCDLKPDNVLLKLNMANQLVAVISDFGLAKVRRAFRMVLFLGALIHTRGWC